MTSPPKEGTAWAAAIALALPALLFPLYNPDLFWHLSAARWTLEHRALPRADFLSFTASGAPWSDFEWLSELVFYGVHSLGGMVGLWLFKTLLVAGCFLPLLGVLRLHRVAPFYQAASLGLWSLGMLAHSDIRPELFSLLFFSIVLLWLERRRFGVRALVGLFALFALWSNLHGGFAFGLALIDIWALGALLAGEWALAGSFLAAGVVGALGTLCNPYGLGPWRVAWEHWRMRSDLSLYIKEWHPLTFENPLHWPHWAMLFVCAGLILYRLSKTGWRKTPLAPLLAVLYFGASALAHTRVSVYFNAVGVVFMLTTARSLGWTDMKTSKATAQTAAVVCAAYLLWAVPHVRWDSVFNYKYVPRRAAEFMGQERGAVEPLKVFNPWEWGGYLGWRLPWHKVYGDGRYIFHDQLKETSESSNNAGAWQEFMTRKGLDGALVPNIDTRFPTERAYKDKTTRTFLRPWYLFFMPRERWALVFWDDQALLFLSRTAVSKEWLRLHEYRYLLPKDEEAFAEARRLKEIPEDRLAEERERHAFEAR